jgi:hypothetical protein
LEEAHQASATAARPAREAAKLFCFVFPRPIARVLFSYHLNLRFICTSTLLVRDFSDRQLCAFDLIDLSLYRCLQPGASFVIFFTHPFLTFPAIEYLQKKAIEKEKKMQKGPTNGKF